MPKSEENANRRDRQSRSITALWHNFHFSGRVIMCSVLFGLGLVLIGSLIYVIHMDDDSTKLPEGTPSDGVPTKPPNDVVGPVVMGIGCFIVIVGVIMCLFETQICRKKTGDSSPLISDGTANSNKNDLESSVSPSTSHSHRHRNHKSPASPKRSKGRHGKSRSKERNQQKSPSSRTPPITIETPKGFMTSSEEKFLTPPNTFNDETPLVHSSSRDAVNQTSSSLMKSFTSSGPSWSQSTEFETPSTSFRDSSVSLNNSIEVEDDQEKRKKNAAGLIKSDVKSEFLTPITLEEEKIEEMSGKIQNLRKEVNKTQGKEEISMQFNSTDEKPLSGDKITSKADSEEFNVKLKDHKTKAMEENIGKCENEETTADLMGEVENESSKQSTALIYTHKSMSHENDKNKSLETIKSVVSEKQHENEEIDESTLNHSTEAEFDLRENSRSKENVSKDISKTNDSKNINLSLEEENTKTESNEEDEEIDLESSVSSNETVVSKESVIPEPTDHEIIAEEELNPQKIPSDKIVALTAAKSANDVVASQNNDASHQSTQPSVKERESHASESKNSQNEDQKSIEEMVEFPKESTS